MQRTLGIENRDTADLCETTRLAKLQRTVRESGRGFSSPVQCWLLTSEQCQLCHLDVASEQLASQQDLVMLTQRLSNLVSDQKTPQNSDGQHWEYTMEEGLSVEGQSGLHSESLSQSSKKAK